MGERCYHFRAVRILLADIAPTNQTVHSAHAIIYSSFIPLESCCQTSPAFPWNHRLGISRYEFGDIACAQLNASLRSNQDANVCDWLGVDPSRCKRGRARGRERERERERGARTTEAPRESQLGPTYTCVCLRLGWHRISVWPCPWTGSSAVKMPVADEDKDKCVTDTWRNVRWAHQCERRGRCACASRRVLVLFGCGCGVGGSLFHPESSGFLVASFFSSFLIYFSGFQS